MGTWNVRGTNGEGAIKNLVNEMKKYSIDLLAVQETKQKGSQMEAVEDSVFFNSGNNERRFGTGLIIGEKLKASVIDFKPISERICSIRIRGKYRKISVLCVHGPTEDKDEDEKDCFYEELQKQLHKIPRYDIKLIMGDSNAKVERETCFKSVTGGNSQHEKSNGNGKKLIEFALEEQMKIMSTNFQHKTIHKGTWRSPAGDTVNQTDHVLIQT